jgi:hypothetical protein
MPEIGMSIGAEIGASATYVTAQPFSAMAQSALMALQDQGVKVEVEAPQLAPGLAGAFNGGSLAVNQDQAAPSSPQVRAVAPAVQPGQRR